MSAQHDLFDDPRKKARTRDPRTSHQGAQEIVASGRAASHRQRILRSIKLHPGLMFRDLAMRTRIDAYAVSKRLTELEQAGEAHGLDVGGRARRWFPGPHPMGPLAARVSSRERLDTLIVAAREVVANWEKGDLAAAVRRLDSVLNEIAGPAPAGRIDG